MPSSSLVLGLSTTLVTLSLFSSSFAAPQKLASRQATTPSYSYTLAKQYSGSTFFDNFNFYSSSDPTHGFVTYGNRAYAQSNGLIGFDGDYAVMKVDSTTNLGKGKNYYRNNGNDEYYSTNGVGRKSVRIEGADQFTHGLLLADIGQMPGGICGTWPAFWTLGQSQWPTDGEIDIIEGANAQGGNWMSLHTGSSSNIVGNRDVFSADITATDCNVRLSDPNPNYTGCKFEDGDTSTFSNYQGGVWAMQWTSDRIKVWYWPYGSVPRDVTNGQPQPGTAAWGTPRSSFAPPQNLRVDQNFRNHRLIFDTTFCGDLGDATWASTGCASRTGYASCADFVANSPSAFANAQWKVRYVKIFKEGAVVSSTTTTSRTTTTSTTSTTTTTTTRSRTSSSSTTTSLSTTSTTARTSNSLSTSRTTPRSTTSSVTTSTTNSRTINPTLITTTSTTSTTNSRTVNPTIITPSNTARTTTDPRTIDPTLITTTSSRTASTGATSPSSSTIRTTSRAGPSSTSTVIVLPTLTGTTTTSGTISSGTVIISPILISTPNSFSPIATEEATSTGWESWSTSTSPTPSNSWETWSTTSFGPEETIWNTWDSTTTTLSSSEAWQTWSPDDTESVNKHTGSESYDGKSDSGKPYNGKPETSKPETSKPETSKPETSKPETSKPETSKPETGKPDNGEPNYSEPNNDEPSYEKPFTTTRQGSGFYPGRPGHGDGTDAGITTIITDVITVPCPTAPGFETKTNIYATVVPGHPDSPDKGRIWSDDSKSSATKTATEVGDKWTPSESTDSRKGTEPSPTWATWSSDKPSTPSKTNQVNDPSSTWVSWQHPKFTNDKPTNAQPTAWPVWTNTVPPSLPVLSVTLKPVPIASSTSTESWASWSYSSALADPSAGPIKALPGSNMAGNSGGNLSIFQGAAASVTADVGVLTFLAFAVLGGMFLL